MPLTPEILATFFLASILLAVTPGPTMSLIIANATSFGPRAGLLTVAGNAAGLSLLMTIVTLGLSSVMSFMASWFEWIRWIGAAYLIWLGILRLNAMRRGKVSLEGHTVRAGRWFWQGLIVAVSNPKVLLFLGAFVPQFVDVSRPALPQLVALSIVFVVTLVGVDAAYAVAIGRARTMLAARWQRTMDGATGSLLILAGLWLAAARRP